MLDELLGDLFERDNRQPREGGQQRRGIRGLLDRLFGGDDEEHDEPTNRDRREHRQRDRERERDSDFGWD